MATNSTGDITKTNKSEMEKKSTETKTKMNVLIVDDNLVIRKLHEKIITKIGGVSQMAVNGEEAVNLHQEGASFDLILMDNEMPEKDGVWATKKLREMKVPSKIIGVTSITEEEKRKAFMEAGLDDCVTKPLTEANLLPLISHLLHG